MGALEASQAGAGASARFRGLRAFRLFDSNDVDETRQRISDIMQPHVLQPMAGFPRHRGTMDYYQLGRIGIGTIRFGRMSVDVRELADYHLLVFSPQGHARVCFDGSERMLSGSRGICIAPGERFRADFSDDCRQLVVRIDRRALDEHLDTSDARLAPDIDLSTASLCGWASLLNGLTSSRETLELVRDSPAVAQRYEGLMLALLAAGHAERPSPRTRRVMPGGIRRAEAFMRANMSDPITLPQIAAAAGMSVRALLENYRTCQSHSPMRTLRDMRLDHVHERLRVEHNRSITEVATEAGFSHLSRFAQDYRDRFGVTPSAERRTRAR